MLHGIEPDKVLHSRAQSEITPTPGAGEKVLPTIQTNTGKMRSEQIRPDYNKL